MITGRVKFKILSAEYRPGHKVQSFPLVVTFEVKDTACSTGRVTLVIEGSRLSRLTALCRAIGEPELYSGTPWEKQNSMWRYFPTHKLINKTGECEVIGGNVIANFYDTQARGRKLEFDALRI